MKAGTHSKKMAVRGFGTAVASYAVFVVADTSVVWNRLSDRAATGLDGSGVCRHQSIEDLKTPMKAVINHHGTTTPPTQYVM